MHDFNPGITQNGLFWTVVLPADNVQVDLSAGTARLAVDNLHMEDHYSLENSFLGDIEQPTPAVMSFTVVWNMPGSVNHYDNSAQKFRGVFSNASAQIEYSGRSGDFDFQSDPLLSSTTVAAEIGWESNGSFY